MLKKSAGNSGVVLFPAKHLQNLLYITVWPFLEMGYNLMLVGSSVNV
jgi:hypothetical protein